VVYLAGHRSGFAGDLVAVSGRNGAYTVTGVLAGTYPELVAARAGYTDAVATSVRVGARPAHRDLTLRRSTGSAGG
jgi:extracellular elastinolytic metalloproteinase